MLPVIAIVGRPNVGKSTLFNRIVGRRQALVDDTAGVTRDRHYGKGDWCGHKFVLIDTGGLVEGEEKSIQAFIKKQTVTAIGEADSIICVFDGREGPVSLDRHIIDILRKAGKPIVYAVNKVDITARPGPKQGRRVALPIGGAAFGGSSATTDLNEFYELKLGKSAKVIPISAEHGRGVDDLLDVVVSDPKFQIAKTDQGSQVEDRDLRVAVIGRPNAGKSTLINYLVGSERVIAHEMPGTTRDTIDVEINVDDKRYIFVDTAGLKKKGKTIGALDKFSAIKTLDAIGRAELVLLVVDANEGFTHQDSALLDYAWKGGKAVMILFNKWDDLKTPGTELKEFYDEKLLQLHKVPYLCISAKTGLMMETLFPKLEKLGEAFRTRLPTSRLNDIMEGLKMSHNIPTYKGRAVKIFYATQVGTSPPNIVVFANQPDGVHESYKRYLMNKLQDVIGLGVPVRIKFKSKKVKGKREK